MSSDSDRTLRFDVPGFNFRPRCEEVPSLLGSLVGSRVKRGEFNPWRLRRSMTRAGFLDVRGLENEGELEAAAGA